MHAFYLLNNKLRKALIQDVFAFTSLVPVHCNASGLPENRHSLEQQLPQVPASSHLRRVLEGHLFDR